MKKLLLLAFVSILLLTGCSKATDSNVPLEQLTTEELSRFDGKAGNKCYVAVSGNVYLISNSSSWVNGIHLDSKGKASCGKDLTEAITDSPHGVSILTTSPKVKLVGKIVS